MGIALWLEQNVGYRILMLHDKLYKSTDGRIGHKIPLPGVAPSLLLHTVGAKTGKQRSGHTPAARTADGDILALEHQLADLLGVSVRIAHGEAGGTLSLAYSTLDQLDMICQRLTGETI